MKIEATAAEILALLQLAELDARATAPASETVQTRRAATRKRVAKALLERYEALREAGRHPAITAIDRGVCSGCHVRLPTMVESQSRRLLAVYTCPHCRRMLYAADLLGGSGTPKPAAPESKPKPRRQSSAQRS